MPFAARVSDGRGESDRAGRDRGSAGPGPDRPEPALRAPWPAAALAAAIVLSYALQQATGNPGAVAAALGLRPRDLLQGGAAGLLTSLFVHAGWTHDLLNALAALAFGAPVARLLGSRGVQAAAFFLFFLTCGVIGGVGFALLHLENGGLLIGASGGVAGLMGAASRIAPRTFLVAPLRSRPVLVMALVWLAANVAIGLIGVDLGGGATPVAWEAHVAGYAAGLLLLVPVRTLTRPR